jgi:hypothetical protein
MPKPENIIPPKKGEVRNPKGKPKGTRNRSTIVREWLSVQQVVKNPITGERETLDQSDMMTLALISKARKGDVQAYKELMQYLPYSDNNDTENEIIIKIIE